MRTGYYKWIESFPKRIWYMTAGGRWASRTPNKEDVERRKRLAEFMSGVQILDMPLGE